MMQIARKVNCRLLPVKLHYFLYYGGEANVLPFISVIAGQIGISATALGIIFTVLPFASLAAKPLFGRIADHFQKLKFILFIFVALACVSYLSIGFIPPMHPFDETASMDVSIYCDNNGSFFRVDEIISANCMDSTKSNITSYIFDCSSCSGANVSRKGMENNTVPSMEIPICNFNHSMYYIEFAKTAYSPDEKAEITSFQWKGLPVLPVCVTPHIFNCSMACDNHQPIKNVYETMQFWLFFLFAMLAVASSGVVTSLSDAACFELLEGKDEHYGKQRMWGTIGWGLFCLLTGYLNDLVTANSPIKSYSPSFYTLGALIVCDLYVITRSKIRNSKISKQPMTNVCGLLSQSRILLFVFVVFVVGSLTGLHWTYFFWYMNELKANQLTMSLAVGIQSFLGELPFFFFAGKIISKIGHLHATNIALILYSLRYVLYSFIYDPWLVLPVELIQGPTFGLFYAAMTSYAKFIAPQRSEATMQGILGGVFEGLGVAVGCLLGGIGIGYYGTHRTFVAAGVVALVCCIFNTVLYLSLPCRKDTVSKGNREKIKEETEESPWIS